MPSSCLQLMIVASHGRALANDPGAVFGATGGSIGCSTDNTLALLDDDGTVSPRHAIVTAHGDGWHLLNTSDHAAIAVNGKLVAPRADVKLHAGDIINIGPYVLQAALNAAQPAWHLPRPIGLTGALSAAGSAEDGSNPLYRPAPLLAYADDLQIVDGATPPLHDLLDTPLDPLALFGAPTPDSPVARWSDTNWHEASASDLFANLIAPTPAKPFDAPRADNAPGLAIRDDVPEIKSHLQLKIVPPTEAAPFDEQADRQADDDPPRTGYGDAFGRAKDASPCIVRVTMPNYGVKLHAPVVPCHGESITESETNSITNTQHGTRGDSSSALLPLTASPSAPHLALAQAFLDGAGVAVGAAANAGFTPEFMHTLGTLVRALKLKSSQN